MQKNKIKAHLPLTCTWKLIPFGKGLLRRSSGLSMYEAIHITSSLGNPNENNTPFIKPTGISKNGSTHFSSFSWSDSSAKGCIGK